MATLTDGLRPPEKDQPQAGAGRPQARHDRPRQQPERDLRPEDAPPEVRGPEASAGQGDGGRRLERTALPQVF